MLYPTEYEIRPPGALNPLTPGESFTQQGADGSLRRVRKLSILSLYRNHCGNIEVQSLSTLWFWLARSIKPVEIHLQLVQICCENVMIDGILRKLAQRLNDGFTRVHDDVRSGLYSVINNGLAEKVIEEICENRRFAH
ncbi:HTH_48 domain-containing protein [Trichonephila clavipes]|nr:HTH_48 domain-containing protein [Trichonephila clavipes]